MIRMDQLIGQGTCQYSEAEHTVSRGSSVCLVLMHEARACSAITEIQNWTFEGRLARRELASSLCSRPRM